MVFLRLQVEVQVLLARCLAVTHRDALALMHNLGVEKGCERDVVVLARPVARVEAVQLAQVHERHLNHPVRHVRGRRHVGEAGAVYDRD